MWFGHPFRTRHSRHDKTKEDGPVFLQWVDCVWQVGSVSKPLEIKQIYFFDTVTV